MINIITASDKSLLGILWAVLIIIAVILIVYLWVRATKSLTGIETKFKNVLRDEWRKR